MRQQMKHRFLFDSVYPESYKKCNTPVWSRFQLDHPSLINNSTVAFLVTVSEANIFSRHLTDMEQSTVNIGRI